MIIYCTKNLINGKIYIGQDRYNNPKYFGSGLKLKQAIKKYGKNNFEKSILQECHSLEELNKAEKYWIKELKSQNRNIGYNIADGGTGGKIVKEPWNKGIKMPPLSNEQKKKQSEIMKAKYKSGEIINGMVGKKPWNKGLPMSEETKEILRLTSTGRKMSIETKEKMSLIKKGKKPYEMNDKIREKIKIASIGRKASDTAKTNMSRARKGDSSCAGPVVKCPHCGKSGTNNAMRRWHFDNCKNKGDNDETTKTNYSF